MAYRLEFAKPKNRNVHIPDEVQVLNLYAKHHQRQGGKLHTYPFTVPTHEKYEFIVKCLYSNLVVLMKGAVVEIKLKEVTESGEKTRTY